MNKYDEAVSALVDYLEAFPTDAEAWCELADLYQSNALSAQAIFSLEEALLVTPNYRDRSSISYEALSYATIM